MPKKKGYGGSMNYGGQGDMGGPMQQGDLGGYSGGQKKGGGKMSKMNYGKQHNPHNGMPGGYKGQKRSARKR